MGVEEGQRHTPEDTPLMYRSRVMTTPQGTGAPTNLCPLTLTLPMGFLKDTIGARFTKGICRGPPGGREVDGG